MTCHGQNFPASATQSGVWLRTCGDSVQNAPSGDASLTAIISARACARSWIASSRSAT